MGLDASTSTIGISLLKETGELILLTHFKPRTLNNVDQHIMLLNKCEQFKVFISNLNFKNEDLKTIVVERALVSSTNINTSAMLNSYQGMLLHTLRETFPNAILELPTVDETRRLVLPELIKDKKLWNAVPSVLKGRKKNSDLKKLIVLACISNRYSDIKWTLNRNKILAKNNFDKADSVVVGLYHLIKNKLFVPEKYDIEKILSIVGKYLDYIDWIEIIKGTKIEQDVLKKYYVENLTKLNENLNIEIYI